jgi:hypothetical protein
LFEKNCMFLSYIKLQHRSVKECAVCWRLRRNLALIVFYLVQSYRHREQRAGTRA